MEGDLLGGRERLRRRDIGEEDVFLGMVSLEGQPELFVVAWSLEDFELTDDCVDHF